LKVGCLVSLSWFHSDFTPLCFFFHRDASGRKSRVSGFSVYFHRDASGRKSRVSGFRYASGRKSWVSGFSVPQKSGVWFFGECRVSGFAGVANVGCLVLRVWFCGRGFAGVVLR
jgi:hypothetical protein